VQDYDDPNYPSEEDGEEVSEAQYAEDGATIHEVYEEAARRREKREKRGEGGEETEVGDDEEAGGADDDEDQGKSSTADHTALKLSHSLPLRARSFVLIHASLSLGIAVRPAK
jgi:hypothetical protein